MQAHVGPPGPPDAGPFTIAGTTTTKATIFSRTAAFPQPTNPVPTMAA
jgi:hypothetical protein